MNSIRKIRVLVVDDSIFYRQVLIRGISSDPNIVVVGEAGDPFEARDKIIELKPDVMTCDIEMPKMGGIDFIRKLIPQYPIPIVVVSTVSKSVFDAMNAGAVDFVTKPDLQSVKSVEEFIYELIRKIKVASTVKTFNIAEDNIRKNVISETSGDIKLIAIGASTGGTEAIFNILKCLSKDVPGILIVQHIPPVFSTMFAERLNNTTNLTVKEAKTGDYIERGLVLVAPGDEHMRVKRIGERYKIECFKGDKVNGHCPSVDVLFDSVAKEVGESAIGIILTGMGYDGARGLLGMRRKGAKTIGQDEETSVVYGMPKVAYELGAVQKQVALLNIPQVLSLMLRK